MGKLQKNQNPSSANKFLFQKTQGGGGGKCKKLENLENGQTEKYQKARNCKKLENTNKHVQTHEDRTISFINKSIHVIDGSLGATRLGAARWYNSRMGYTVRIGNEGVSLGQQRHCMLHGNLLCLSAVATTW